MHTHTSVKGVPSFSLSEGDHVDLRQSGAFKVWPYMEKTKVLAIQRRYPWLISIGVLGLALVLLFYHLGDGSLHDWDEAIYAQVAREMLLSDTWMSLYLEWHTLFPQTSSVLLAHRRHLQNDRRQ